MSLVVTFSDMPLTRWRSPALVPASLFHWSPPLSNRTVYKQPFFKKEKSSVEYLGINLTKEAK